MNDIENARAEIRKYFDPSRGIEGSEDFEVSPSGNYRLETKSYQLAKPDVNWVVKLVRIYDVNSSQKMFEFLTDSDRFFYTWAEKNGQELFIGSEILEGGQTVINLTDNMMHSYCSKDASFIWTDYFLSPSKSMLAVIGCHWASPYEIKIYNFSHPFRLPLKLIETFDLEPEDKEEIKWVNKGTFKVSTEAGVDKTHHINSA